MWPKIWFIVIAAAINILMADIDATRIKNGKRIYHGINGAIYISLLAVCFYLFRDIWLIAALCFERLMVFNPLLSKFRGLGLFYVSPERKSIIDKIAFFFFRYNGKLMYACYAASFIFLSYKSILCR